MSQEKKLPKALAIVNPKRDDSRYPFRELSGAGVVYKLLQGLSKIYPEKIDEKFLKWNLDLVAISTISDVVPLVSENRIIAKYGLTVLKKSKNIGLRELYKIAEIDESKLDAYTVGFQIGPRINAPGRIGDAAPSFSLLISNNAAQASEDAKHLQQQNENRQSQMDRIIVSASKDIEKNGLIKDKIILLKNKNWAKGVIGPVASQLTEKYCRPTILLAEDCDTLDGSCRSISCFDIVTALERQKKFLLGFGGHKAAAGVHLKKENFDDFYLAIIEYANSVISDQDILPRIYIDFELPAEKITQSLIKKIEDLEPFGLSNPRPVFVTRDLLLSSHRLVGRENNHLQLRFKTSLSDLKGVVFNHSLDIKKIKSGEKYDIVYQPQLNFWNGKNWIDLRIMDIKLSSEK